MSEMAVANGAGITAQQKQAALEAVLQSHTFARADQLKSFLKFVCEMELAGRGQELTEYLIGVEALGRSPNYSPGDDSAVRNRAFALRKKLQEYYENEQPENLLRIELTKGSYCPHFVEYHRQPSPKPFEPIAKEEAFEAALEPLVPEEVMVGFPPAPASRKGLYWAFLVGVALSGPIVARTHQLLGSLRDLFAATFFLFFGLQIDPANAGLDGIKVAAENRKQKLQQIEDSRVLQEIIAKRGIGQ